jgi:hypothetical protein
MSLAVGSNSYVTVAEADAYFSDRYNSINWFSLDETPSTPGNESKETYLTTSYYILRGHDSVNLPATSTEENVKTAQLEFALYLLKHIEEHEERDAVQAQGLTKFQFSKRTEEFSGSGASLPSVVKGLLSAYMTGNTFAQLKGAYDV